VIYVYLTELKPLLLLLAEKSRSCQWLPQFPSEPPLHQARVFLMPSKSIFGDRFFLVFFFFFFFCFFFFFFGGLSDRFGLVRPVLGFWFLCVLDLRTFWQSSFGRRNIQIIQLQIWTPVGSTRFGFLCNCNYKSRERATEPCRDLVHETTKVCGLSWPAVLIARRFKILKRQENFYMILNFLGIPEAAHLYVQPPYTGPAV
jgi:hypothetical protein